MKYYQEKGSQCHRLAAIGLLSFVLSLVTTSNIQGQISYVDCDINGDRNVNIEDAILGLQVLSGLSVANLTLPGNGEIDLPKALYTIQVQAGIRANQDLLVDWDGDGFNGVSGDCDETDVDINPGQPEVCGDDRDNNCDGQIDEGCSETTATPPGANVAVSALGFDFVFDSVVTGGETTVEVTTAVPNPPTGFLWNGRYYNVSTTAQIAGPVQVCINYDDTGMNLTEEASLQIFHYDQGAGQWQGITSVQVDTQNNIVCGESPGFSPFALGFSSLVGDWTIHYDYFCDGMTEATGTWAFYDIDILPDYAGFTNFKASTSDYYTWSWNSIGVTFSIDMISIIVPGTISGNSISGRYDSYNGPVCYSGTRQ